MQHRYEARLNISSFVDRLMPLLNSHKNFLRDHNTTTPRKKLLSEVRFV